MIRLSRATGQLSLIMAIGVIFEWQPLKTGRYRSDKECCRNRSEIGVETEVTSWLP